MARARPKPGGCFFFSFLGALYAAEQYVICAIAFSSNSAGRNGISTAHVHIRTLAREKKH